MNRRGFLKRASLAGGGVVSAATLGVLSACATAWNGGGRAPPARRRMSKAGSAGYGALAPTADQDGREVLALPSGFRYVTFGRTGEAMSDGFPTPRNHDGMTCFAAPDGTLRLIRNHELRNRAGDFRRGVLGPAATRYDPRAAGGCVSLDFDPQARRLVRAFVSLNGTIVNCAGGLAYGDTGWISCEETIAGAAHGFARPHGYNFLVPRDREAPRTAVPLTAMGRFAHEAAVADDETGIVYQTEDAGGNSGFYRFLPHDPADLYAGGVLQMLAVRGVANYDARAGQVLDAELPVAWVTIADPDPEVPSGAHSCFAQGFAGGAARFRRLEGIFRGDEGSLYFVSTSGGDAGLGQLWQYRPDASGGTLALRFESPGGSVLDSPDNLCVTPSGAVLLCEDDATRTDGDTHPLAPGITEVNRLIGLSPAGEPFEFAVNVLNGSEFAGACFSPDGEILFVNIFGDGEAGSGMTCAIWGPWGSGPL